jgi:hypothetical protein
VRSYSFPKLLLLADSSESYIVITDIIKRTQADLQAAKALSKIVIEK